MISADTGSPIWNVTGRSIAIVAVAPMPGRTPINVPSNTPIRQKPRFASVDAVEKPSATLLKSSISAPLERPPGPETLVGQREGITEHNDGEDRDRSRKNECCERFHAH